MAIIGLIITAKTMAATTSVRWEPKLEKVRLDPSAIKKTIKKKSRNGRKRALISCADGKGAKQIPASSAPISLDSPILANSAAAPRPQAMANKNKNSWLEAIML